MADGEARRHSVQGDDVSEQVQGVEIKGSQGERFDEILTADALEFVARLHGEHDGTRRELEGPELFARRAGPRRSRSPKREIRGT